MTVTHKKVDNIPSFTQAQLNAQIALGNYPTGTSINDIVLSGDWNDTHIVALTPADFTTASGTPSSSTFLRGDNTWAAAGGNPGGSDTQIQFNDGGTFNGIGTLVYNKSTGVLTNSATGSASKGAEIFTGTPFAGTGSNSTPLLYLNNGVTQPTNLNTAGCYFGVNAFASYAGEFFNCRINGNSSVFIVNSGGQVNASGNVIANSLVSGGAGFIGWGGASRMLTPADGIITMYNNAQTSFTRLQFGGTSSSFTALNMNGTVLEAKLADNSNYANFSALNLSTAVVGGGLQIKSGTNGRIGVGTLSAGTLAVANTSVTANTRVFLQDTSTSTTNVGSFTVTTSAGVGFTVTSTNVLDASTFNYILIESI